MHIVILGCGRVGAMLANMLSKAKHKVTIIDRNVDAFWRLDTDYAGAKIAGMGIDEEVLRRAGLDSADVFISVTNGDNTNVMAGQIAQHKFKVPRVIVRLYDPIRAKTYREFGLTTICTSVIGAGIIHDLIMDKPQKRIEDYLETCGLVEEIFPDLKDESKDGAASKEGE